MGVLNFMICPPVIQQKTHALSIRHANFKKNFTVAFSQGVSNHAPIAQLFKHTHIQENNQSEATLFPAKPSATLYLTIE